MQFAGANDDNVRSQGPLSYYTFNPLVPKGPPFDE